MQTIIKWKNWKTDVHQSVSDEKLLYIIILFYEMFIDFKFNKL